MDEYVSKETALELLCEKCPEQCIVLCCPTYLRIHQLHAANVKPAVYCKNIGVYAETDQFICSNCGIELRGWYEVTVETNMIGDGELVGCDFAFKYCPKCGAEIKKEDINEANNGNKCTIDAG